jgi:hypothetical protein
MQKADFEFSEPFAYLKHHLSDFMKVSFYVSRVAENIIAFNKFVF